MVAMTARALLVFVLAALAAVAPAVEASAKSKRIPGCAKPKARAGEWRFYGGTLNNHREQLKEKIEYSKQAMAAGSDYAKGLESNIGQGLESLPSRSPTRPAHPTRRSRAIR